MHLPNHKPEDSLRFPENLVWAIVLMGMMILVTYVSV